MEKNQYAPCPGSEPAGGEGTPPGQSEGISDANTVFHCNCGIALYYGLFLCADIKRTGTAAQILKELALLRRPEILGNWAITGVFCIGLVSALKALLNQRAETVYDDLYGRKEILFARKMFSMDYADMDKQQTHDLRAQIQQNKTGQAGA